MLTIHRYCPVSTVHIPNRNNAPEKLFLITSKQKQLFSTMQVIISRLYKTIFQSTAEKEIMSIS